MVRWDRKVYGQAVQWREVFSEWGVSGPVLFDIGRDVSGRPMRRLTLAHDGHDAATLVQ